MSNLAFLDKAFQDKSVSVEVLVTEYFYTTLHMFEAALSDFPQRGKRDCENHGVRTKLLSDLAFETQSPFMGIAQDYKALQGLSERARYLSAAGTSSYIPLVPIKDYPIARELYETVKNKLEGIYTEKKKGIPWAK